MSKNYNFSLFEYIMVSKILTMNMQNFCIIPLTEATKSKLELGPINR